MLPVVIENAPVEYTPEAVKSVDKLLEVNTTLPPAPPVPDVTATVVPAETAMSPAVELTVTVLPVTRAEFAACATKLLSEYKFKSDEPIAFTLFT